MTSNAHDLSLRILAGFLSIIMTLLMFLPMKAAFGESLPEWSGHDSGRMNVASEPIQTPTYPAVADFRSPATR